MLRLTFAPTFDERTLGKAAKRSVPSDSTRERGGALRGSRFDVLARVKSVGAGDTYRSE